MATEAGLEAGLWAGLEAELTSSKEEGRWAPGSLVDDRPGTAASSLVQWGDGLEVGDSILIPAFRCLPHGISTWLLSG